VLTGCSLATVRGPDASRPSGEAPRCTRTARQPVAMDGFLALMSGLSGVGLIGDGGQKNSDGEIAGGVALEAVTVGLIASAIVGFRRADECQQAWDVYANGGQR